jgi:site-specific DNA recombinase
MIAAVYARKSTDDSDRNAEARSTTRQVERATEYAQRKGWTVDPRYIFVDENTSGAEWKQRPGFNALLAALTPRPPFDVVIVSELSRIGRDTVRTPAAVMQIEDAGVEIRSYLSDAPISLADESSEIHTIFNSLAASFERRRARQRTHDALRRRAEAGAVANGRVYGYRNERDGQGYVHRAIDEAEAAIVRRIFTLYAEGDGLTRIAKRLNTEAVPAPRVGTGSWSPSALREIIRRPLYDGRIVWNRSQRIMRHGTRAQRWRPESEWLHREAPELRIVSPELWRLVAVRRERAATSCASLTASGQRRARPMGGDLHSPHLLSGLAQCAACGGSLIAVTRMHGPTGQRRRAPFYGCMRHHTRGRMVCKNDVVILQATLEAAFLDALAEAIDGRVIARAVEKATARLPRRRQAVPEARAALAREQETVQAGIRNLVMAVRSGHATETLLAELADQEARGKALARQLADLDVRPVTVDSGALVARLTALAGDIRGLLDERGPRVRRLLQRVLAGRRVACEAFRESGRKGYRFTTTGTYSGLMSHDMSGSPVRPSDGRNTS